MQIRFSNTSCFSGGGIKQSPFDVLQQHYAAVQQQTDQFIPGSKYWQFNINGTIAKCPDQNVAEENFLKIRAIIGNQSKVIGQLINILYSQSRTSD
jgi:hypothetical protein